MTHLQRPSSFPPPFYAAPAGRNCDLNEIIFKVSLTRMCPRARSSPFSQTNRRGCPVCTHSVLLWAHAGREDDIRSTRTVELDDAMQNQLLTRGVSHVSHPLFRKARTEQPPPSPAPAVERVRGAARDQLLLHHCCAKEVAEGLLWNSEHAESTRITSTFV